MNEPVEQDLIIFSKLIVRVKIINQISITRSQNAIPTKE